jgi:hypothetical protein
MRREGFGVEVEMDVENEDEDEMRMRMWQQAKISLVPRKHRSVSVILPVRRVPRFRVPLCCLRR